MFESGFPYEIQDYVHQVSDKMSLKTYNNIPKTHRDDSRHDK